MKFLPLILLGWCLAGAAATDLLPLTNKLISVFDPRRDVISDDYEAGAFLIYNCEQQHWVCVLEEYYEKCQQMREQDARFKKEFARCAPVKEFDVKFSCFQEQLRLVSNVDSARLCVLENWKSKSLTLE